MESVRGPFSLESEGLVGKGDAGTLVLSRKQEEPLRGKGGEEVRCCRSAIPRALEAEAGSEPEMGAGGGPVRPSLGTEKASPSSALKANGLLGSPSAE